MNGVLGLNSTNLSSLYASNIYLSKAFCLHGNLQTVCSFWFGLLFESQDHVSLRMTIFCRRPPGIDWHWYQMSDSCVKQQKFVFWTRRVRETDVWLSSPDWWQVCLWVTGSCFSDIASVEEYWLWFCVICLHKPLAKKAEMKGRLY